MGLAHRLAKGHLVCSYCQRLVNLCQGLYRWRRVCFFYWLRWAQIFFLARWVKLEDLELWQRVFTPLILLFRPIIYPDRRPFSQRAFHITGKLVSIPIHLLVRHQVWDLPVAFLCNHLRPRSRMYNGYAGAAPRRHSECLIHKSLPLLLNHFQAAGFLPIVRCLLEAAWDSIFEILGISLGFHKGRSETVVTTTFMHGTLIQATLSGWGLVVLGEHGNTPFRIFRHDCLGRGTHTLARGYWHGWVLGLTHFILLQDLISLMWYPCLIEVFLS
jgi:hypothetical protein